MRHAERGSVMLPVLVMCSLIGVLGVALLRGTDDGMATQRYLREQQVMMSVQITALSILRDPAACATNFAGTTLPAGVPNDFTRILSSGEPGASVFVTKDDVLDYQVVRLVSLRLYDFEPYTATGDGRFRGTVNAELGFAAADGGGAVRVRNVLLAVTLNGFPPVTGGPANAVRACNAVGVNSDLWQMTGAGDIFYGGRSVGIGTTNPQTNPDPTRHNLQVANFVLANDYYHPSDARLKRDLRDVSGLDVIERLHGVRFAWANGLGTAYGVVAQNVEGVVPEAVDANGEFKRVDYEQLIAPLVASVRELAEKNRELRRRLARLRE